MTDKTVEEIATILEGVEYDEVRVDNPYYDPNSEWDTEEFWVERPWESFWERLIDMSPELPRSEEVPGLGVVHFVELEDAERHVGHVEVVFRICERFFSKKRGYYSSYDGFVWDGPVTEVRPAEKVITVYRPI